MSEHQEEPGHGNSIAAWTAVIIAIIGTGLLTLGVLIINSPLIIAGAVLSVLSIVIGPVLAKLGYGVAGKSIKV